MVKSEGGEIPSSCISVLIPVLLTQYRAKICGIENDLIVKGETV